MLRTLGTLAIGFLAGVFAHQKNITASMRQNPVLLHATLDEVMKTEEGQQAFQEALVRLRKDGLGPTRLSQDKAQELSEALASLTSFAQVKAWAEAHGLDHSQVVALHEMLQNNLGDLGLGLPKSTPRWLGADDMFKPVRMAGHESAEAPAEEAVVS